MKVSIDQIKPNPSNPRVIRDERFKKLVQSIRNFPEMLEKRPLVCYTDTDKKLIVLGGNMRLRAAQEIGLTHLPVILADDWSEEKRNEFLIKDNISFGAWDFDELANNWYEVQLMEWGLELPIDEAESEHEEKDKQSWSIKVTFDTEEAALSLYQKLTDEGHDVTLN